jgi:hypothetical protein
MRCLPALLLAACACAGAAHAAPMKLSDYMALSGPAPSATLPLWQRALAIRRAVPAGRQRAVPGRGAGARRLLDQGVRRHHAIAQYGRRLAARGIAAWNVEYRRVDEDGGGYPGMYQDMNAALDLLQRRRSAIRSTSNAWPRSATRPAASWCSGWRRARIPDSSPLYRKDALPVRAVVSLGGLADLRREPPSSSPAAGATRYSWPACPARRGRTSSPTPMPAT